jgi:branched-chain amino acid aminotransferase
MEEGLCYVNGSFVPASEAKVSIFDRGFTSGEGVYDVTRSFGHKLFKLDEHIARLYRSLKYVRIDCGMPAEEMTRLSVEVFERNKHLLGPDDDCAVWQVISRGVDRFSKGRPVTATVAVFCVPIAYHSFAREYVEGCILVTPSIRRTPPQSLEAKAKNAAAMVNDGLRSWQTLNRSWRCWNGEPARQTTMPGVWLGFARASGREPE